MGAVVLKDLEKWYGRTCGCIHINLKINPGEFFTLLGPSGCGKSTILRLIAGFIQPDNGAVFIGSRNITPIAPEKRDVGMVFQNYALFPFMSVWENIEYGIKIRVKSSSDVKKRTEHYLSMVGLDGLENRPVSQLSGGEQQRVALARSLAVQPKVLLLDEPLSNLDAGLRNTLRTELKRLQKELGITTIFVTHDQTEALTLSDRLGVFNRGRCIQTGTPEQIYHHPETAFAAGFVGETNLFPVMEKDNAYYLPNGERLKVEYTPKIKYVSIRPQHLVLSQPPANHENSLKGEIIEKQFNGLSSEFVIQSGQMTFRAVKLNTGPFSDHFSVGRKVSVDFSSSDICFLKA